MNNRQITRRDLIKRFGAIAFVMSPVSRAMGYLAGPPLATAPRFVMFFKGGSFHPQSTRPSSVADLSGTPLSPMQAHADDLILFQNMRVHGGSPKSDGYQEEHAAGLFGCVTGHRYKYSQGDAYFAYTDHQSIDVAIANHYQSRPELQALPFASLHIGAGAHSDADNVGLGQRYISFRNRAPGDSTYGNAIEPIQDAGQVYNQLMQRVSLICSQDSNRPATDQSELRSALARRQSLLDFRLEEISAAKRSLGQGSEHARKLDGLLDGWRETEKAINAERAALDNGQGTATQSCPSGMAPTGDGEGLADCDALSPVHDQMIALIKLAFEWDLTRVVAFTLSGASSGQRWPSQGVRRAHHSLEHGNDVQGLNTMGRYYSGKFAHLLESLKGVDDGNGQTALHNSAVLLGMECWSDSASGHYLTDIPFVLAGQAGGQFKTGRIIDADRRSNNDLLISIQNACGIDAPTFGLESLCSGAIV